LQQNKNIFFDLLTNIDVVHDTVDYVSEIDISFNIKKIKFALLFCGDPTSDDVEYSIVFYDGTKKIFDNDAPRCDFIDDNEFNDIKSVKQIMKTYKLTSPKFYKLILRTLIIIGLSFDVDLLFLYEENHYVES
jgi:hypothetical protein